MGVSVLTAQTVGLQFERRGDPPLVVLNDLTLEVKNGELFGVLGRSGAGKTSLLQILAGLRSASCGRVFWSGTDIWMLNDQRRTDLRRSTLGYVFQSAALMPSLTAKENVMLPAAGWRLGFSPSARAIELLGQLHLSGRGNHFPDELSGGEQQRVALARALFLRPKIIIADEPTANLDRESADAMLQILGSLRDEGHTVIVASHDPHLEPYLNARLELD